MPNEHPQNVYTLQVTPETAIPPMRLLRGHDAIQLAVNSNADFERAMEIAQALKREHHFDGKIILHEQIGVLHPGDHQKMVSAIQQVRQSTPPSGMNGAVIKTNTTDIEPQACLAAMMLCQAYVDEIHIFVGPKSKRAGQATRLAQEWRDYGFDGDITCIEPQADDRARKYYEYALGEGWISSYVTSTPIASQLR